ncbi:hypothetical protein [Streptomyces syringium]|uniref:hypothetical protein n=1 Tax=Streptomyces syringium TaxID=76729 RepID=UPI00341F98CE
MSRCCQSLLSPSGHGQISPRLARTYFTEISAGSAVPLDLDELVSMVRLHQHGHVVLGDVAVRCYKYRLKWTYDERDIRRTAQVFADFRLDPGDVVEVQVPPYREHGDQEPEERGRADWREQIASWMYWDARDKHRREGRTKSGTTAGSASAPAGCPVNCPGRSSLQSRAGAGGASATRGRWS